MNPAAALDQPSWAALSSAQANLAVGSELAKRFHPEVAPFAAVFQRTPEAWRALSALISAGEEVVLLSLEPIDELPALKPTSLGTVHQMVDTVSIPDNRPNDLAIARLGPADVHDMVELAHTTKPGPFLTRTLETGHYIGIRDHGRLIAMAGERMRFAGHVEISAVCVDQAWRGRGIAAGLMNILRHEIQARGDTPFLHVFSSNQSAIGLYERLGFRIRQTFHLIRVGLANA